MTPDLKIAVKVWCPDDYDEPEWDNIDPARKVPVALAAEQLAERRWREYAQEGEHCIHVRDTDGKLHRFTVEARLAVEFVAHREYA